MTSHQKRRRRDPEATREAILEAAQVRLAKDGPEALSLSEVARLAGVNRGTAYQHFETREKLVKATIDWVSEKLYGAVFGDREQGAERRVEQVDVPALTDKLAAFAVDNPELCRIWLQQVISSPDSSSDIFWTEYQGSMARFAETELAEGNIDTEVLSVIMLAGAFLWPVWARTHGKGEGDWKKLARRFSTECLRLSMYGSLRAQHYPEIVERLRVDASPGAEVDVNLKLPGSGH